MKGWVVAILSLLAADARADVFGFKDAAGFEKCMQLDHLVEQVRTGDGAQTRILGPKEIQPRCVDAAVKLVARTKDKALAFECVQITKREAAPVLALDLIGGLVELSLPACNEMAVYEVLLQPLTSGQEANGPKAKATVIIKRCLKDATFKKDFLEELSSGDEARARNACRILLEEKLAKSCKGAK